MVSNVIQDLPAERYEVEEEEDMKQVLACITPFFGCVLGKSMGEYTKKRIPSGTKTAHSLVFTIAITHNGRGQQSSVLRVAVL